MRHDADPLTRHSIGHKVDRPGLAGSPSFWRWQATKNAISSTDWSVKIPDRNKINQLKIVATPQIPGLLVASKPRRPAAELTPSDFRTEESDGQ